MFRKLDLFPSSCQNLGHFIQLLKSVNLQSLDTLVSFDVVSLFTNVPVDEALQVIRNKLHNDNTLAEWSVLQVEAILELLEVCLKTTYFQVDNKFFQRKSGMTMGSSLSPIVSNIFMEHFEELAFDSTIQTITVALICWWYICGLAPRLRAVTEFPQPPQ
jgi:hypothetical protein